MRATGETKKLAYLRYYGHLNSSRQRGIEFHFTFEEWVMWWETNLGPDWLKKRGTMKDQYVMAREGDCGPYSKWNVKCITKSENSKEQAALRARKLTERQVRSIYLTLKAHPIGLRRELAKKYGVSQWTIKAIQKKRAWSLVTDLLD